jgi:hypothetical protein
MKSYHTLFDEIQKEARLLMKSRELSSTSPSVNAPSIVQNIVDILMYLPPYIRYAGITIVCISIIYAIRRYTRDSH